MSILSSHAYNKLKHMAIMAEISSDDAKTLQESLSVLTSVLSRVSHSVSMVSN